MNLANKITLARVLMIPIFLVVLLTNIFEDPNRRYIALGIFIIASLSDMLDGYIARSRNLVTDFGKFADPLADKLLVCSALISLIEMNELPAWVVIIIISREFIITGIRLVAASKKIVIAASFWAKVKTATQMLMICLLLLGFNGVIFDAVEVLLIVLAVSFTIVSGVEYVIKNINVFRDMKS